MDACLVETPEHNIELWPKTLVLLKSSSNRPQTQEWLILDAFHKMSQIIAQSQKKSENLRGHVKFQFLPKTRKTETGDLERSMNSGHVK